MKRSPIVVALLLGAWPLHPGALAGPQAAPQAEVPTFSVGTAAVTLDVVVRDKKGNVVRDLKASDFEVFEDGVKQRVESFTVFGLPTDEDVAKGDTPAAAPGAVTPAAPAALPAAPEETQKQPQVIAFVFDRLSASARDMARKAALTYLERGHVAGDLVGIFSIDLALRTIQPFTRETSLIQLGLERAASQGNTSFANDRGKTRDVIDAVTSAEQILDATGAAPGGPGTSSANISASAGSAGVTQALATIQAGMLRSFETLERDQQGLATSHSLLAVVSGLKSLPGRKTVVFFSEGLMIPDNVRAEFRSVINTANRANVSVYTMDAAGLRAQSMNEETKKEMLQAQSRRLRQMASGRDDSSNGIMTRNLERNEDLLRLNPESGLAQLANETGGFLIRDTNDAGSAFRRIEEDMRFYYLVAYTPSNESYDGRFRTVSVKVTRPGVQVQTRQGYYAIRAVESVPLKGFEAPALAQLDRSPRPSAFPLQTVGLSLPTAQRPGLVPVLVRVPGNAMSYVRDEEDKSGKKMQRADFAVVVRIKNEANQEVDRLSQRYVLSVPEASLAAARKGDILFYRDADLAPGRYTLEAVGYDALAQKAGVQTAVLDMPKVEKGRIRLSSIMVVGRVEKVSPSDGSGDSPFRFGETLLYPAMGEPFRKAASPALGFYFVVFGGDESGAPKKATIEVYRGGQPVGRVTADLPAADATGRIQYAGSLPLQTFPPGSYQLKVTASDGSGADTHATPFTITE
jgi:VWFA-related protein